MTTTLRIVPQAPTQPMPELAAFLQPFHVQFARSEGPQALERYLTGLLTELPSKTCQTMRGRLMGGSGRHDPSGSTNRIAVPVGDAFQHTPILGTTGATSFTSRRSEAEPR